ncbi:conditioned medium-induced protein 4 [Haloarcula nitratireducens]|uniref:Conditioned medium-induced protein 4 n=1 Tax=Haloarcula nitratireducens TaxID=2487749 RepID=A0AAW4PDK3_9EURY|nr:conditioned medium-induced protein 4 [Halomicroarcula nitratireducens]MBX0296009.1 conditioned medium-induced protein 4 [Halomicroarcula nitratireducens]
MDEKTEELRDIFMDVSEEGTVTESQEATHGTLADVDEAELDDRLADVVSRMRERYEFRTDLDDDALVTVVRGFYEGREDDAIADGLGVAGATVTDARLDLHLFRDSDTDADFDVTAFRRRIAEDDPTDDELVAAFDVSEAEVANYRRVVEAQAAARQVSHRFQSEFEDVLTDAGLSTRMTESLRQDGLDEATEDIDSLDSDADVSM